MAEAKDARLRIRQDLIDALEHCQMLRNQDGRQLLADLLADSLDSPISLRGDSVPRQQLTHIVLDCCAQTDGLHRLVDVVAVLDPHSQAVEELALARDEWHAFRALPTEDWNDLRKALTSIHFDNEAGLLRKLVGIATGHRVQDLPKTHHTVWAAFLHLAGANTATGSLPPAMTFLECVAEEIGDSEVADELRRQNGAWAERFDLTDRLERTIRIAADSRKAGEPNSVYLVIQLDPAPADPERFLLSHWRQWEGGPWGPHRHDHQPVPRHQLERKVDELLCDLEIELGAGQRIPAPGAINLEFVVPWEMLNTPFEFWRKSSMSRDTVPLAIDHAVVLRSLERMRYRRSHLAWKQRWRSLTTQSASNRLYQGAPSGDDYFAMLAAHLADDQIVGFVLSEPPGNHDGTAWREASLAFRAGIPALLWDHVDCSSKLFREALDRLLDQGSVVELPRLVAELRREARGDHFTDNEHAGKSIAILWDNPERLFDSGLWFDPERGINS